MIIAIGDNCIDHYLPPVDKKFPGGNAVNVVANLQKHGQPAMYIGTVGRDELGEIIISKLQEIGVNTSFISQVEGPTGITQIEIKDREYFIKSENYGVSAHVKLTDTVIDFLKNNASLIHLSLTGGAMELMKTLKYLNIPISCDISTQHYLHDQNYWNGLLPHLDYVFVSGGSVAAVGQIRRLISGIASYGPHHIMVTRGSKGCIAYSDGREVWQSSLLHSSEVIDPLGAGDAFISGFLHSVSSNENGVEQHLLQASDWAADACKGHGAW